MAIDPAGSANKRSDETGIIGVGGQHFDEDGERLRAPLTFVLGDATLKGTPTEWAAQAYKMARLIDAHYIVAEKNFGGEMVKEVLENYAKLHPEEAKNSQGETFVIKVVHAAKSKETRAEGLVNRYEQGRVTHIISKTVFGDLSELEKEQVNWVPRSRGGKSASPNRVDALVWGGREVDSAVKHETQASDREAVQMVRPTARAYA